ncbi:MAG: sterol desaturase family protein [Pseudohongiella sp.]|nr:sterol desaturase family protein [Pseudohongiella sp.]
MDLILYAIPFFFLAILLEFVYGLIIKNNTYRINDSINSLSMGSLSRLQSLVILGLSASVFELINLEFQLTQLADDETWVWLGCFVLYDLAYYWKHRLGHEIAIFWGSHVAHHQSEDFNLGTALRQTSIDFYGFLFYLPFFVLGFPAEILFTVVSLNLIYQFWVHTEHVPKLGALEWVFVTPSNHRVHHARNKIYVDKNYGGVFIIWDRLFGSFQQELDEERVVFGLRKPLNSWNPVWANVHVYWRLIEDFLKAPGMANKFKICFKPPGWQPAGMKSSCQLGPAEVDLSRRFDPAISSFSRYYTFVQFILTIVLSLYILLNATSIGYSITALTVAYLTYSFYVQGVWLEAKSTALGLEIFRLTVLMISLVLLDFNATLSGLLLLCAGISLIAVLTAARNRVSGLPTSQ